MSDKFVRVDSRDRLGQVEHYTFLIDRSDLEELKTFGWRFNDEEGWFELYYDQEAIDENDKGRQPLHGSSHIQILENLDEDEEYT